MPFPINRPILGAPDLIGAKTWPQNPSNVNDEVRMVYDATADFLAGRQRGAGYLGFVIAALGNTQTTIPSNEAWYAYRLSFYTGGVLAAGNSLAVSPWYSVRDPVQGILAIYSPVSKTAGPGEQLIHTFEIGCWLAPGTMWGVNASVFAGAGIVGNLHMHYVPVLL